MTEEYTEGYIKMKWQDTNNDDREAYVFCKNVPVKNQGPADLVIPGATVVPVPGQNYDWLIINISKEEPQGIDNDRKIVMELADQLDTDQMVLPYNGGVPWPPNPETHITIKVNR